MKKLNSSLTNVRFITIGLAVFLLFAMPAAAMAANYYVKTPANGGDDSNAGTSWTAAKATIQAAMDLATVLGDKVNVAAGTYNEKVAFPDLDAIQLLGGYPAAGEGTRAPWTHTTIIDGSGAGTTGAMVNVPYAADHRGYYGIVIDGFTIRNGINNSDYGTGGIQSLTLGVTIRNCIIENNNASSSGLAGGIYISCGHLDNGNPVIEKNIIRNNNANVGPGGISFDGAGMKSSNYNATMTNTLIYGNTGSVGNHVFYPGGVTITNCTIADNAVPGINIAGYSAFESGQANIKNSIIWHPGGDDIYVDPSGGWLTGLTYSDVHDTGDTGTGVIHTDPAFVGSGDYHLTSSSGDCIDGGTASGAPSTDLEGTSRPQGGGDDMGAYEYTPPVEPDITVTDDKGTANDLQVPFGEVTVGESADATVTITNDGTTDLDIGTITDPDSPFSIDAAACSGQSLDPSASCDCTVTFAPTETGAFNSSFSIPSDDPDENPVTVSISGTGVSAVVQYTLTTDVDPPGSGTITLDPPGGKYNEGSSVTLTATVGDGYMFDGWNGEVDDPDAAVTTTTMNADKTVTAMFMADNDNDGVPTEEEQGPDGTDITYDGDNSGYPDSEEGNVASGHTYDASYYVTLAVPATQSLADVETNDNPSPSDSPDGVSFPYGFFDFTITGITSGDATTVTIYLPAGEEPTTYWKYGPTPTDGTDHWYEFLYDGTTGAEFNGNVITLHFVDGDRGDDDLAANGIISDAGAPGEPTAADSSSSSCFISVLSR